MNKQPMPGKLCRTLTPLVLIALTAATYGASQAATTKAQAPEPAASRQSPEKLQELEEVLARGKRLAERITDAENEFFPFYNKLNKNDDYDIYCGVRALEPGSMITTRACTAGFFSKSYGAPAYAWGPCYGTYLGGRFGYFITGPCNDGGYEPPSAEFILMSKSADMRRNMEKVIASDPRLQIMAEHIGDLYYQMESVRLRNAKARGIKIKVTKLPSAKSGKTITGPRSL